MGLKLSEKRNLKKNIFFFLSYLIFFTSIIGMIFLNYFYEKPISFFQGVFNLINTNVENYKGIRKFNTLGNYFEYAERIKSASSNKEKYELIQEFLTLYATPYIGFLEPDQGSKIRKYQKNKIPEPFTFITNTEFQYILIPSLWSDQSYFKIIKTIQSQDKPVIIDLRNLAFGKDTNWITFYAAFLPSDTIWYFQPDINLQKKTSIEFSQYKFHDFSTREIYFLINSKTAGIHLSFITQLIKLQQSGENKLLHYKVIRTDNLPLQVHRCVSYRYLKKNALVYYPNINYYTSDYCLFDSIDEKIFYTLSAFPKVQMFLNKNSMNTMSDER